MKLYCKNGHERTEKNTYVTTRGHKECRDCRNLNAKCFRKKNPDKIKQANKKWLKEKGYNHHKEKYKERQLVILNHRYGITVEEFDALVEKQNNKCLICKKEFLKTPRVDNDHAMGVVRGLLCRDCKDKLEWLELYSEVIKEYICPITSS